MSKGVIYFTKIRGEYAGSHMEHMIGEKLLETGLKKEFGIDLEYEPKAEGEHGKPFLALRPYIHYNISHSGEYVVCILAEEEVGIDIQVHRKVNYEKMLQRMVPAQEYETILKQEDAEQIFFTQWVLREAYIKWTGEGLSRDMRTICMEEGTHTLLHLEEGYSGALWSMNPVELRWEYAEVDLESV